MRFKIAQSIACVFCPPISPALQVGNYSTPTAVDINGDGRKDLVVGSGNGYLHYFQRTEDLQGVATYAAVTGDANPLKSDAINVGYYSAPAFVESPRPGLVFSSRATMLFG